MIPFTMAVWLLTLTATSAFAQEYIRVPERQTHTDVKAGPSSGSIVLVLIPSGTVLPVTKRDGEWIQVKLSAELRTVGIPMRWYKNEQLGFVHDSTVEVIKGPPAGQNHCPQEPPASTPPRAVRASARPADEHRYQGRSELRIHRAAARATRNGPACPGSSGRVGARAPLARAAPHRNADALVQERRHRVRARVDGRSVHEVIGREPHDGPTSIVRCLGPRSDRVGRSADHGQR